MINLNATLLIQLANFLLLMFLLNRILFRPMVRLLDERRERTEGRKKKAVETESQAQAIWDDYQKKIHDAKAEADRVRAQVVRKAEAEREKLLEGAAASAEKTVTQVRARVRAEAEDARKALREEAERLGAAAAERILGRAM